MFHFRFMMITRFTEGVYVEMNKKVGFRVYH